MNEDIFDKELAKANLKKKFDSPSHKKSIDYLIDYAGLDEKETEDAISFKTLQEISEANRYPENRDTIESILANEDFSGANEFLKSKKEAEESIVKESSRRFLLSRVLNSLGAPKNPESLEPNRASDSIVGGVYNAVGRGIMNIAKAENDVLGWGADIIGDEESSKSFRKKSEAFEKFNQSVFPKQWKDEYKQLTGKPLSKDDDDFSSFAFDVLESLPLNGLQLSMAVMSGGSTSATVLLFLQNAMMMGGEHQAKARQVMERAGATEEEIQSVARFESLGVGLVNAVGETIMEKMQAKYFVDDLVPFLKLKATDIAKGGVKLVGTSTGEAVTEASQELVSNVPIKLLHDENQDVMEGVADSAKIGFASSMLLTGGGSVVTNGYKATDMIKAKALGLDMGFELDADPVDVRAQRISKASSGLLKRWIKEYQYFGISDSETAQMIVDEAEKKGVFGTGVDEAVLNRFKEKFGTEQTTATTADATAPVDATTPVDDVTATEQAPVEATAQTQPAQETVTEPAETTGEYQYEAQKHPNTETPPSEESNKFWAEFDGLDENGFKDKLSKLDDKEFNNLTSGKYGNIGTQGVIAEVVHQEYLKRNEAKTSVTNQKSGQVTGQVDEQVDTTKPIDEDLSDENINALLDQLENQSKENKDSQSTTPDGSTGKMHSKETGGNTVHRAKSIDELSAIFGVAQMRLKYKGLGGVKIILESRDDVDYKGYYDLNEQAVHINIKKIRSLAKLKAVLVGHEDFVHRWVKSALPEEYAKMEARVDAGEMNGLVGDYKNTPEIDKNLTFNEVASLPVDTLAELHKKEQRLAELDKNYEPVNYFDKKGNLNAVGKEEAIAHTMEEEIEVDADSFEKEDKNSIISKLYQYLKPKLGFKPSEQEFKDIAKKAFKKYREGFNRKATFSSQSSQEKKEGSSKNYSKDLGTDNADGTSKKKPSKSQKQINTGLKNEIKTHLEGADAGKEYLKYPIGSIDDLREFAPEAMPFFEKGLSTFGKKDRNRIEKNLEDLKYSAWAQATLKALATRGAIRIALKGDDISSLDYSYLLGKGGGERITKLTMFEDLLYGGEKGIPHMIRKYNFIGGNRKAEIDLSTSYTHCNPSPKCSTDCYASSKEQMISTIAKQEFTDYMLEFHLDATADRIMQEFKTTDSYVHDLALRLNDKGDLSVHQVALVEKMNAKGVRMQIFSKRPELLSQISDYNLKMLSIDASNVEIAYKYPELQLAVVLDDDFKVSDIKALNDRVAVYLPVNLKGVEWSQAELKARYPEMFADMKTKICPVEDGSKVTDANINFVDIIDKSKPTRVKTYDKDGNVTSSAPAWKCTACDKLGTFGCYFGKNKTSVVNELYGTGNATLDLNSLTPEKAIAKLMQNVTIEYQKGTIDEQSFTRLYNAYSATRESIRETNKSNRQKNAKEEADSVVSRQDGGNRSTGKDEKGKNGKTETGTKYSKDIGDLWSDDFYDDRKNQKIPSGDTSRNQVPATKSLPAFLDLLKKGGINADIGGGLYDEFSKFLKTYGVKNWIFDPFNRKKWFNKISASKIKDGQADTVTVNNVLNVIAEDEIKERVIQQAHNAVKPDGTVFFKIHTGDGDRNSRVSKEKNGVDLSWQEHRPTSDYVPMIEKYFGEVTTNTKKGDIIIAKSPIAYSKEMNNDRVATKKGTVIKRYKNNVGKEVGSQVYVHKNYASEVVPESVLEKAKKKVGDFKYNAIMYDRTTGAVRFDEAPNFDAQSEPVVGKMITVKENGDVKESSTDMIWHHKWLWVKDDYKGFDVQKSKDWSKEWASKLDGIAKGNRAGFDEQLRSSNADKNIMYSKELDTTKLDKDYMKAVNSGDMVTAQKMVDEKAVENGYSLEKLYHGTKNDFTIFNRDYAKSNTKAKNGTLGFYFTDSKKVAESFGKRIVSSYLKSNLMDLGFTVIRNKNIDIHESVDGYPALKKWILNVVNNKINTNGAKDYNDLSDKDFEGFRDFVKNKGINGIKLNTSTDSVEIVSRTDNFRVSHKKPHNMYIVFDPNQIKSADPVTKDDDGNVIPLSKRFDSTSKDIRYSKVMDLPTGDLVTRTVNGKYPIGIDKILTPDDAVTAFLPIAKEARETVMMLVTNINGKPLAMINHAVGMSNRAQIYMSEIANQVILEKGAHYVWMAHNHPSGSIAHSLGDQNMYDMIVQLFKGTDIEFRGGFVLTQNGTATFLAGDGTGATQIAVPRVPTSKKVSSVGRQLTGVTSNLPKISSSSDFEDFIFTGGDGQFKEGITFANQQNTPLGFIEYKGDYNFIRGGRPSSLWKRILEKMSKTNATGIFISRELPPTDSELKNIQRMTNSVELRLLDFLSGSGTKKDSARDDGKLGAPDTSKVFYSKDIRDRNDVNPDDMSENIKKNAFQRALDRYLSYIEQGKGLPKLPVTKRLEILRSINDNLQEGNIDKAKSELGDLLEQMELKRETDNLTKGGIRRGSTEVLKRLLGALGDDVISQKSYDLAEWLIKKNPALLDELGISILKPLEDAPTVIGRYYELAKKMVIFKNLNQQDVTPIHEMLHHFERYMPLESRQAIIDEYSDRMIELMNSKDPAVVKFANAVVNTMGNRKNEGYEMLKKGELDFNEYYQYITPSEFWAVNGSELLTKRFEAKGSVWQRTMNWLKELSEKLKSIFGFSSNAPLIKALNQLEKADGTMTAKKGLGDSGKKYTNEVAPDKKFSKDIDTGINISDKNQPFTEQILSGKKTIETRDTNSLKSKVGKRVGLIRTNTGKATLVGYADIGEPIIYNDEAEFRADEDKHLVKEGSEYDIKDGQIKYGYPLSNVERIQPVEVNSKGIVSRDISDINAPEINAVRYSKWLYSSIEANGLKMNITDGSYRFADKNGNEAGYVVLDPKDQSKVSMIHTTSSEDSKGLISAMFDAIEESTGVQISPSENLVTNGHGMWYTMNEGEPRGSLKGYEDKLIGKSVDTGLSGDWVITGVNDTVVTVEPKKEDFKRMIEAERAQHEGLPSKRKVNPKLMYSKADLEKIDVGAKHQKSFQTFLNMFTGYINGTDKTITDAEKIAQDIVDRAIEDIDYIYEITLANTKYENVLADEKSNNLLFVMARPENLDLRDAMRMEDGMPFDRNNTDHLVWATPEQLKLDNSLRTDGVSVKYKLLEDAKTLNKERIQAISKLWDYLKDKGVEINGKTDGDITVYEKAVVLFLASRYAYRYNGDKIVIEDIDKTSRHKISVVDGTMVEPIIATIRQGLPVKKAFMAGVDNAMKKAMTDHYTYLKDGWNLFEQSDKHDDAVKLNLACAGTTWCTYHQGVATAEDHLSGGDFYVFSKEGKSEIAIRTDNGRVKELRGNTKHQTLLEWHLETLEKKLKTDSRIKDTDLFFEHKALTEAMTKFLKTGEIGIALAKELKYITKKVDGVWTDLIVFSGTKYYHGYDENGKFNALVVDAIEKKAMSMFPTPQELLYKTGIAMDMNLLTPENVKRIKYIGDYEKMLNKKTVDYKEGKYDHRDDYINLELPNLVEIAGNWVLGKDFKADKLTKIGDNTIIGASLNHIETLGNNIQTLKGAQLDGVVSMGNDSFLRVSMPSLTELGHSAYIGEGVEMNSLVTIGRTALIKGSLPLITEVKSNTVIGETANIPNVKSVGDNCSVRGVHSSIETIGEECVLGSTHIDTTVLDNLVEIGGNTEIKNARLPKLVKVPNYVAISDCKKGDIVIREAGDRFIIDSSLDTLEIVGNNFRIESSLEFVNLRVAGSSLTTLNAKLPNIEEIGVDSVLGYHDENATDVVFEKLHTIKSRCRIKGVFPALTKTGNDVIITGRADNLKRASWGSTLTGNFPRLEEVGQSSRLKGIFPSLTIVGNKVEVVGIASALKNVDGSIMLRGIFQSLETIGSGSVWGRADKLEIPKGNPSFFLYGYFNKISNKSTPIQVEDGTKALVDIANYNENKYLVGISPEFYKQDVVMKMTLEEVLAQGVAPRNADTEPTRFYSKTEFLRLELPEKEKNSMKAFVQMFEPFIKQQDKTLTDANRIAEKIVDKGLKTLADNAELFTEEPDEYDHDVIQEVEELRANVDQSQWLVAMADPNLLQLEPYLKMDDGKQYDPSNVVHQLRVTPRQLELYEANKNENTRRYVLREEADEINKLRIRGMERLWNYLKDNKDYSILEKAIVAKLAGRYGYSYDKKNEKVTINDIEPKNRFGVTVVDASMVAPIINAVRQGKSGAKAFLQGVTEGVKRSMETNKENMTNGWHKFDQSEEYADGEKLSRACAGTPWCTHTGGGDLATKQLAGGDFYVFYQDGVPEIAIRTNDGKIAEIRGNTPDQRLNNWNYPIVEKKLRGDKNITGGNQFYDDKALMDSVEKVLVHGEVDRLILMNLRIKDSKFAFENKNPIFEFVGKKKLTGYDDDGSFNSTVLESIDSKIAEKFQTLEQILEETGVALHPSLITEKNASKIKYLGDSKGLSRIKHLGKTISSTVDIDLPNVIEIGDGWTLRGDTPNLLKAGEGVTLRASANKLTELGSRAIIGYNAEVDSLKVAPEDSELDGGGRNIEHISSRCRISEGAVYENVKTIDPDVVIMGSLPNVTVLGDEIKVTNTAKIPKVKKMGKGGVIFGEHGSIEEVGENTHIGSDKNRNAKTVLDGLKKIGSFCEIENSRLISLKTVPNSINVHSCETSDLFIEKAGESFRPSISISTLTHVDRNFYPSDNLTFKNLIQTGSGAVLVGVDAPKLERVGNGSIIRMQTIIIRDDFSKNRLAKTLPSLIQAGDMTRLEGNFPVLSYAGDDTYLDGVFEHLTSAGSRVKIKGRANELERVGTDCELIGEFNSLVSIATGFQMDWGIAESIDFNSVTAKQFNAKGVFKSFTGNETPVWVRSTKENTVETVILNTKDVERANMTKGKLYYSKDIGSKDNNPKFDKWFGNSVVTNDDGSALTVYHGTPRGGFDAFDENKLSMSTLMSAYGAGFYFTDKKNARTYMKPVNKVMSGLRPQLYDTHLKIENPFYIDIKSSVIPLAQIKEIIAKGDNPYFDRWVSFSTEGAGKTKAEIDKMSKAEKADWFVEHHKDVGIGRDTVMLSEMVRAYKSPKLLLENMKSIFGKDGVVWTDKHGKVYSAWSSTQIKSASENNGEYSDVNPNIYYSKELSLRGLNFYSQLQKAVEEMDFHKMTTHELWRRLHNIPSVKPEEIEWSGLKEYFEAIAKTEGVMLKKENILAVIADNGVHLEEVVYAEGDYGGRTFYKPYSTKGGKNYREHLLLLDRMKDIKYDFATHHFDEKPNILVHSRTSDFADKLLIDELQSDLHQTGRKSGYKRSEDEWKADVAKIADKFNNFGHSKLSETIDYIIENNDFAVKLGLTQNPEVVAELSKLKDEYLKKISKKSIPQLAPFSKSWIQLMMKRMISKAVSEGKSTVAWANGEMVHERFRIDNKLKSIRYVDKGDEFGYLEATALSGADLSDDRLSSPIDPELLKDYIGEELADRLLSMPKKDGRGGKYQELKGETMVQNGEGIISFYNHFIPSEVKKLLEKLDKNIKVYRGNIDGARTDGAVQDKEFWMFDISDKLKESVKGGMKLFSKDLGSNRMASRDIDFMSDGLKGKFGYDAKNPINPDKVGWQQAIFDKFDPIKQFGEGLYRQMRMTKGYNTAVKSFLDNGGLFWEGNSPSVRTRGRGVMSIIRRLGAEKFRKLMLYRVGKRAQFLSVPRWRDGRMVVRERHFTQAEIQEMIDFGREFDAQELRMLNQMMDELNKQVVDFAVEAGMINDEHAQMMEQEFYVPFYRVMDDRDSNFLFGSVTGQNIRDFIETINGGTELMKDPFENLIRNWSELIKLSIMNKARKAVYDEMKRKQGLIKNLSPDAGRIILEATDNTSESVVEMMFSDKEQIMSHMENGLPVKYKVEDIGLFKALTEPVSEYQRQLWFKFLSVPKMSLTLGATLSPAFKLANMIRDVMSTTLTHGDFNAITSTIRGMVSIIRQDENYVKILASGGIFDSGYVNEGNTEATAKEMLELSKSWNKRLITLNSSNSLWQFWEKVGSISENASRVGLGIEMLKKGESLTDASFSARDILDFSMKGTSEAVRFLSATIPFLNARLQGIKKLGKQARVNPTRLVTASSGMAIASALLALFNNDREEYNNLDDFERFTYWHFWVGDTHIRIPKPFELSIIANYAEGLVDVLKKREQPKQMWDITSAFLTDTLAIDLPTALKVPVELYFNESSFTGREIVPEYLKDLPPSQRGAPWGSQTLKLISRGMEKLGIDTFIESTGADVSPQTFEHIIRGFTASLGEGILWGTDAMIELTIDDRIMPTKRIDDAPLVGRFFREREQRSSRYVTEFHHIIKDMQKIKRRHEAYENGLQQEDADALYEKEEWAFSKGLNDQRLAVKRFLREKNALVNDIYDDETMTPKEKAREIQNLENQKKEMAKEFYDAYMEEKK